MKSRLAFLTLLVAALCGGAVYAAFQLHSSAPEPPSLAAFVPSGSLLAIETPNFAALLQSWTNSHEEKRWLAGDDSAAFSRSRLFSRLGDAQTQFTSAAGLAPDAGFLQQIAGGHSLFAWYNINQLEFLYITRLPAGVAAKLPLLALRTQFEQRTAGGTPFFIKTDGDPARTVAFAVRGDYLILATREDLIANALELMQHPGDRTLEQDPWYAATIAAASAQRPAQAPGDLRMTLNLAKLVPMPFFRSYWVQQNITALKQYSAALSDLYLTPGSFREERILLPADPANQPPAADLSPVLAYLPPHLGVYRAEAQPSANEVLAQLQDTLLSRQPAANASGQTAPAADLSTPTAGDSSDLEQRIDQPLVVAQPEAAALAPLRSLLTSAAATAMLTFSTAASQQPPGAADVFIPIHAAIVLASSTPWNAAALQQSLTTALNPRLSIAAAGLTWTPHHNAAASWCELTGLKSLTLAVQGNIFILASDRATLLQLLSASAAAPHAPQLATTVAGFDHTSEQPAFLHLTAILDHPSRPAEGGVPPFFSGNMASLSRTFDSFTSETFTQAPTLTHIIHQTVVYQRRH